MKKILPFCLLALACNSPAKEEPSAATSAETTPTVELPMKTNYEGKGPASIGSAENTALVMNFNKFMSEKKGAEAGALLADTVVLMMGDGKNYKMGHDSAVAFLGGWLNAMDSIKLSYMAAVPIDSKGAGEEWVVQWTDETYYYKGGKKEHFTVNENYLVKDKKIKQIIQHVRPVQ